MSKLNREWHVANRMPKNATAAQRYAWHREHEQNCACRPMPAKLREQFEAKTGPQKGQDRRNTVLPKVADIDEYLAGLPEDAHATLSRLRSQIKAAVPEAAESISYGLPTFKYRGRPLIYFGAAQNHCAIYGMNTDAHREDLADYDVEKGTIRFAKDHVFPEALLKKLLDARIAAIEAAGDPRKGRK